ncbi:MAG TPA: hypothetical protein VD886_16215 [Herpetosiphonaceae bacterium]|nr:hypothetical protein [Herpetosiphonaceae bacterium]
MDYRVPATAPRPPSRNVAWVGGLSALVLAVSPWLVWWAYEWITVVANPDGSLPPPLRASYPGRSHAFGQLLIAFGLISLAFWAQYARDPARWMRPIAAALAIHALLAGSLLAGAVAAHIVLTRGGLPGMYADAQVGPGLALALGASLIQSGCLAWLVYERLARAGRQRRAW